MKQSDVTQLIKSYLPNDRLTIQDLDMIVKLFQFCFENQIEPVYFSLENSKYYTELKLIERTVEVLINGALPKDVLSETVMNKILNNTQ